MQSNLEAVQQAAAFLKSRIPFTPAAAVITGTGLGEGLASMKVDLAVPYGDIPHFPIATAPGHQGRLLSGTLSGLPVLAFQGRLHLFEGHSPRQVVFPVRVARLLGVRFLMLTNASGGLNLMFSPGDIMLIRDHLNLTGENPLTGPNADAWGPRFPDMTAAYDAGLMDAARRAAVSLSLDLREGVYAGLRGPSLETSAETRFLKIIGADAVGFSTVMETIAAVHGGMKVLGLSTITNINDPDHPTADTEEGIIRAAKEAAGRVSDLLAGIAREIASSEEGW